MTENLYQPNCLRTVTGRYINLLQPEVEDIFCYDIAVGLSRAPRFAGHTKQLYSVAQHSDWCRQQCELIYPGNDALAFKVMMHDAHEYVLCDIPGPLKELMPEYNRVANRLQSAIHTRFGVIISEKDTAIIKEIDKKALEWEWDNKVLRNSGLSLDIDTCAEIFIDHFKRLCKHPFVIK